MWDSSSRKFWVKRFPEEKVMNINNLIFPLKVTACVSHFILNFGDSKGNFAPDTLSNNFLKPIQKVGQSPCRGLFTVPK